MLKKTSYFYGFFCKKLYNDMQLALKLSLLYILNVKSTAYFKLKACWVMKVLTICLLITLHTPLSENKNILRKYSAKWCFEGKHHCNESFNRQISNPSSLPVKSFQCHYWRRAIQVIISSGLQLKSQYPTTSDLPLNPWSQHWSRGRSKDQMCCFKWGLMFFHLFPIIPFQTLPYKNSSLLTVTLWGIHGEVSSPLDKIFNQLLKSQRGMEPEQLTHTSQLEPLDRVSALRSRWFSQQWFIPPRKMCFSWDGVHFKHNNIKNVKVSEKTILLKFNSHVDFSVTIYKYILSCDLKKLWNVSTVHGSVWKQLLRLQLKILSRK